MTMRKGLIVVAGMMAAGAAHAESVPSNTELFRMLKEQQQTISELRSELKQARQDRRAAPANARNAATAASPAARDAAARAPADAYAMYSKAPAVLPAQQGRAYIGAFGGGGSRGSADFGQFGTALFLEALGGPLAVNATGRTSNGTIGFAGAHLGYEWAYGTVLRPALEIEGLRISNFDQRASVVNPTTRLPSHTFDDTLPTSTTVLLANAVVSFRTPYQGITPYIGAGMGAARVAVSGADSTQTASPEPGVNHFNGNPDAATWTYAAQAKAGARIALGDSGAYLFGEYRYLYIGETSHTFGSTVFPGHAPTTAWTVNTGGTSHHLAAGGVGFSF